MKVSLRVEGGLELQAAMREMKTAVQKGILQRSVRQAIQPIAAKVRANAPVKTGALREAVEVVVAGSVSNAGKAAFAKTMKAGGSRAEAAAAARAANREAKWSKVSAEAHVVVAAPHVSFQEFGSSHQPARPFARPAFDSTHGEAFDGLAEIMEVEIAKAAARAAKRAAKAAAKAGQ